TVPAYVSGSLIKDVVVNNGAGSATLTAGFTYIENAPSLTALTPGTGSILGGTTVTLTGSGFAPGTTVTFGGVAATSVTVMNSTTLTAVTPAYSSGSLSVSVVVNNGVANATLINAFTYQAEAPTISSVSPNTGPAAGGTSITIAGSNFVPGTTVTIGGIPASSVTISSTGSLTAEVPAYVSGPLAADVTVTNAEGSTTLAGGFTYTAATPTLTSIAPNSGTTAGGTTITLTGTGFVPGATVQLDGINAVNVQVLNNTTLTAVTPAHASGAVDVVVNNGAGSVTLSAAFTYVGGGLSLSGISPSTGSVAGGTVITLSGANLSGTTSVTVSGVAASGVTVVNATTVTAIVPAYVSGALAADVTVSDGSSNATLVGGFTYQAIAPSITSISPNTSTVAGGVMATVTG
ncbi:IPT/TIG domain-containing protein, partial [Legionella lytica]